MVKFTVISRSHVVTIAMDGWRNQKAFEYQKFRNNCKTSFFVIPNNFQLSLNGSVIHR